MRAYNTVNRITAHIRKIARFSRPNDQEVRQIFHDDLGKLIAHLPTRDQNHLYKSGTLKQLIDLLGPNYHKDSETLASAMHALRWAVHNNKNTQTAAIMSGAFRLLTTLLDHTNNDIRNRALHTLRALVNDVPHHGKFTLYTTRAIRKALRLLNTDNTTYADNALALLNALITTRTVSAFRDFGGIKTLITHLRTNSANLSDYAQNQAIHLLGQVILLNPANRRIITESGGTQHLLELREQNNPHLQESVTFALEQITQRAHRAAAREQAIHHFGHGRFNYLPEDAQPERVGASVANGLVYDTIEHTLWYAKTSTLAQTTDNPQETQEIAVTARALASLECLANNFSRRFAGKATASKLAVTLLKPRIQIEMPRGEAHGIKTHPTPHLISKIIPSFRPFGHMPTFTAGPGPHFLLPVKGDRQLIVKDFGRLLAVAAVLNDTDCINSKGDNIGTVLAYDADGTEYLQCMRIDFGEALNIKQQDIAPVGERMLRTAGTDPKGILKFDDLPSEVKKEFIETLNDILKAPARIIEQHFTVPGTESLEHFHPNGRQAYIDYILARLEKLSSAYQPELEALNQATAQKTLQGARQRLFSQPIAVDKNGTPQPKTIVVHQAMTP